MPPADIRDLFESLAFTVEVVERDLTALARAADAHVRDAADEPILAILMASGAQMLVTGDKDLLALSDRFPIVAAADFCARYAP